jgi:hypothetical protein
LLIRGTKVSSTSQYRRAGGLLVVALLVSCSEPPPTGDTEKSITQHKPPTAIPIESSPTVLASGSGELGPIPELALRPPPDAEAAYHAGIDDLISECMLSAGFQFFHPSSADYLKGIAWRTSEYGLMFPLGDARDPGPTQPVALPTEPDPNGAYLDSLSPDGRSAWYLALSGGEQRSAVTSGVGEIGFPTDGCRTQAYVAFFGASSSQVRAAIDLIGGLELEVHSAALGDPAVIAVQTVWSACLKSAGYAFDTFVDARYAQLPPKEYQAMVATNQECSVKTSAAKIYRETYNREFVALYSADSALLGTARPAIEAAVKNL